MLLIIYVSTCMKHKVCVLEYTMCAGVARHSSGGIGRFHFERLLFFVLHSNIVSHEKVSDPSSQAEV